MRLHIVHSEAPGLENRPWRVMTLRSTQKYELLLTAAFDIFDNILSCVGDTLRGVGRIFKLKDVMYDIDKHCMWTLEKDCFAVIDDDDDDDDGRIAFSVAWVRGLQGHVTNKSHAVVIVIVIVV